MTVDGVRRGGCCFMLDNEDNSTHFDQVKIVPVIQRATAPVFDFLLMPSSSARLSTSRVKQSKLVSAHAETST